MHDGLCMRCACDVVTAPHACTESLALAPAFAADCLPSCVAGRCVLLSPVPMSVSARDDRTRLHVATEPASGSFEDRVSAASLRHRAHVACGAKRNEAKTLAGLITGTPLTDGAWSLELPW